MEVSKSDCYLCRVKFYSLFRKASLFSEVSKKFSTRNELHDEIDTIRTLENVLHGYYEWIANLEKDKLFKLNVLKRVIVENDVFSYAFHCIKALILWKIDQINLNKVDIRN